MTNRELNQAVAEAMGTVQKRWVIGEPGQSIAADTFDGYNPFHSRGHAQKYLDKERAHFKNGSMWDDWEVWEDEVYPMYANDIGIAWRLIEAVSEHTCISLAVDSKILDGGEKEYRVNSDCGIVRGSRNKSSTMPRAICKAYLEWHAEKMKSKRNKE